MSLTCKKKNTMTDLYLRLKHVFFRTLILQVICLCTLIIVAIKINSKSQIPNYVLVNCKLL